MSQPTNNTGPSWEDDVKARARLLHQQLASLQQWVTQAGGDDELLELLAAPVHGLLERLYEEDFPLARVLDRSDFYVHVTGPAADVETPKVSLLSMLFAQYRTEVARIAKALAGVVGGRMPRELDLGFAGFAPGSIYIGFTLPMPDDEGLLPGIITPDPLYAATRQAVRSLGEVSRYLSEGQQLDAVKALLPDPAVRDVVLTAVQHIAPTSQRGLTAVEVGGRELPAPATLTTVTRQEVRRALAQPMAALTGAQTIVGVVREIDLDARRIIIRSVDLDGVSEVRCAYPSGYTDAEATAWVDHAVRVEGRLEPGRRARVGMLWANVVAPVEQ